MTLITAQAIPGREYHPGEKMQIVVDPWHEQHDKVQQLQLVEVDSLVGETVFLRPLGSPWDAPVPGAGGFVIPHFPGEDTFDRDRRSLARHAFVALARLTEEERSKVVSCFCPGCWRLLEPETRCFCRRDD